MRIVLLLSFMFLTGCFGPPIVQMAGLTVTAVDVATVPIKRKILKEVTEQGDDKWQTTVNQKDITTGCYGKCDKKKEMLIDTQTDIVQSGDSTK